MALRVPIFFGGSWYVAMWRPGVLKMRDAVVATKPVATTASPMTVPAWSREYGQGREVGTEVKTLIMSA